MESCHHENEIATKKDASNVELENGNIVQIPDGGWGWVVCFAGFMSHFTTAGICSSNGILLLGLIDRYDATVSETSLIGSLFMASIMCAGPMVLGLLTFNASHRQVIMLGGLVAYLATFPSTFASRIEVLFVTFGIITGTTVGMSYFAVNTLVGSYFSKKRSLAVGIATSGGGCGTIVLTYLTEQSISFYGMPGTFMLMSGVFLNFVVYGALCRPLEPQNNDTFKDLQTESITPNKSGTSALYIITKNDGACGEAELSNLRKSARLRNTDTNKCKYFLFRLCNPKVFKNSSMKFLIISYFFWSATEIALIYLPAKVVDVGLSREESAFIMSIYGIGLSFGEITTGFLVDIFHVPASLIFLSSLLAIPVLLVAFTFCWSFLTFVICTILISISNGFTISLRIVFVASILGVENINSGYSPLSITIGIGYIIYSYATGVLFDAVQSFDAVFYFSAAILFVSATMSCGIIYMEIKGRFQE